MSKRSKIPHDYLLIKIDTVKYRTPCNVYTIEFTNIGYIDDVNWCASKNGMYVFAADTLNDLMESIVEANPFMTSFLYKVLYGIE